MKEAKRKSTKQADINEEVKVRRCQRKKAEQEPSAEQEILRIGEQQKTLTAAQRKAERRAVETEEEKRGRRERDRERTARRRARETEEEREKRRTMERERKVLQRKFSSNNRKNRVVAQSSYLISRFDY